MSKNDIIQRFVIESANVRGEIVQLNHSLTKLFNSHDYSAIEQKLLGQAAVATVLLSATIKFSGQLSLQLQGDQTAPLKLLFAQCDNDFNLRGILRQRETLSNSDLSKLAGRGQLAITIQSVDFPRPYQSLVSLEHKNLAGCLEAYFLQSEQLTTHFYLFANDKSAAGLLLQTLPEKNSTAENWQRISILAQTVREEELLTLSIPKIIKRLFHEEDVRLFTPATVKFRCTCSVEKMSDALRLFDKKEALDILAAEGVIKTTCDFCRHEYLFNHADVEQIFST